VAVPLSPAGSSPALAPLPHRSSGPKSSADGDTMPFRPVRRPPMAVLTVMDDGKEEGELVRIRSDKIVIGRTEGNILIPHDPLMSGRHAEISRVAEKGRYRWFLTDLQSTNGTYVRVTSALLKHGQEMLIGTRRYRFHAAPQGAALLGPGGATGGQPVAGGAPQGTQGWQNVSPNDLIPALIEVVPQGEGPRYLLSRPENWIGRDLGLCSVALANDPMVSPRHARIHSDAKGRWFVENAGSVNGLWIRITRLPIDNAGQFQLGEQRFALRICQ
jgi:pSer/pThr/pTyr-binding forkhead associated (FHA) protein